ncbi:hypothetical protein [Paraburkholderia atlantica]|uniref:hypothetical protein n=1 Tax=Paraburkholderia atlantica TaxID=2654982 RepID=UPI001621250A|nr:hypothetical protein [Paraburkholderia atlantica]MBB5509567.1 hypothetical protein [Paraburkholderia atlantica]
MASSIISAGTPGGRSNATLITEQITRIDASQPGGGVILPMVGSGVFECTLINNTTSAVQLYAQGSDTINGIAGATGYILAANSVANIVNATPGTWHAYGGAVLTSPSNGSQVTVLASQAGSSAMYPGAISTSTYPYQYGTYCIPANTLIQPGAEIEFAFAMNCTSSANAKNVWMTLGGFQIGATVAPTTSLSATGRIRVRCVSSNSQIVDVLSADGSTSTALGSLSLDMTQPQQWILWGMLGGTYPSPDTMSLQSYKITLTIPPAAVTATANLLKPVTPGINTFYGVNTHPGYYPTVSGAQYVQIMQNLGTTVLRMDWFTDGSKLAAFTSVAKAFKGNGMQIYAVIPATMESSPGVAFASETLAYNANYANGQAAATALGPLGITMFGCGNEMDVATAGGVNVRTPNINVLGTVPNDFNNSIWPLLRGALGGLIAGIKSVLPNALCGSNSFVLSSIWASDALWNGTQPDGTTGHATVRWDITDWHVYTEAPATTSGAYFSGNSPILNLMQYISQAYGKPIFISEHNPAIAGVTDSSATAAATVANMANWYGFQGQYNIAGLFFYDMFDSPYQIINNDAPPFTLNQTGVAIKNFIAANPALR